MVDISLNERVLPSNSKGFHEEKTKRVCKECGNKLTIFGRYAHPIKGQKHVICGTCYRKLNRTIEQWRTFVFDHPNLIDSLDINGDRLKNNFEKIVPSIMKKYGNAQYLQLN